MLEEAEERVTERRISKSPKDMWQLVAPLAVGFVVSAQKDTFRLAIQGHALLEQLLDDAIEGALPGGTPKGLRMGFGLRLALARSLGLITPEVATLIEQIAKIRHEFAHAKITHLTNARARQLVEPTRAIFAEPLPAAVELKDADPHAILGAAITVAFIAAQDSILTAEELRKRRDELLRESMHGSALRQAVIEALTPESQDL